MIAKAQTRNVATPDGGLPSAYFLNSTKINIKPRNSRAHRNAWSGFIRNPDRMIAPIAQTASAASAYFNQGIRFTAPARYAAGPVPKGFVDCSFCGLLFIGDTSYISGSKFAAVVPVLFPAKADTAP
jgi:hypothetical protein